jgi:hypothetical protein
VALLGQGDRLEPPVVERAAQLAGQPLVDDLGAAAHSPELDQSVC